MAEWKKIITSGSSAHLNQITASGGFITAGDISSSATGSFGRVEASYLEGTLATATQGNITSLGTLTTLTVDDITINGSTISDAGDFTLDVGTDIEINADGGNIDFKDDTAVLLNVSATKISGSATSTGSFGQLELEGGTFTSASLAAAEAANAVTALNSATENGLVTVGSTTTELDAESNLTFDGNHLLIGSTGQVQFGDTGTFINQKSDGVLDLTADTEVQISTALFDVNATDDVTIDTTDTTGGISIGTSTSGVPITIGHSTSEVTIADNITITGDLTVNGTTTTVASTNTTVQDKFILLNSGSTAGDGGIIVQGGATASGSAFAYDDSADRWGFQSGSLAQDATAIIPESYAAEVVTSDVTSRRKNGNIKISSDEIWIYVE